MTISSEIRTAGPFTGDGVASSFPFSFKVFKATDLVVVRTDDIGVDSTLAYGTQYSVTLNADQNASPGGTITYKIASITAPLPSAYVLNATSAVQNKQPVALTNNGGFYPKVINDALDRLTILVQQLARSINGAIRYPLSDGSSLSGELPNATARKGKYLGFSLADGSPTLFDSTVTPGGTLRIGGSNNSVYGAGDDCVVTGGTDNNITGGAEYSAIAGGFRGAINGGAGNTIAGGQYNTISEDGTTAAADSAIIAGANNYIHQGENVAIIGGSDNSSYGGDDSALVGGRGNSTNGNEQAIIGGSFNTISATATGAAIIGGDSCSISAAATNASASGTRAVASLPNERALSSGRFSTDGDAVGTDICVRNVTTNNTVTNLYINGAAASRYLVVPTDTTWAFSALIVARRTDADNESAAYRVEGCIDNNAGTVALVGSVTTTTIAEDNAGWNASAVADNTNKSLNIQVTGEAAKTVRWHAYVRISKVTG